MGEWSGYVDRRGRFVIAPQNTVGVPFRSGVAQVRLGEKIGYIDRRGEHVRSPRESPASFSAPPTRTC